jgi:DNA-binding NtrC family response regulator
MARVLLLDDDAGLREVLSFALREQGHDVQAAADGERGISLVPTFRPEVIVTDLKMPRMDGIEVMRRAHAIDPNIPVIVLTAFGSIEDAVEAMKMGAYDYLTKPYNRDELRLAIETALERRNLVLENTELRHRLRERSREVTIVHASSTMASIIETVRRIAPSDATVLLSGESGTGKEVIAHALHSWSDRWDQSFVPVNCGAIPRDLIESELFGYTRGAFTGAVKDKPGKFQRADGGTLFLDEVGDLALELQTKLLRVIETKQVDPLGAQKPLQVDIRLIAATNADLEARVRGGTFRSDLYYRLNVIPIRIPPLRERSDDIAALWTHFIKRFSGETNVRTDPDLIRALMARSWPGNVRELANVCQRMVLLRKSDLLTRADLPPSAFDSIARVDAPPESFLGELPEGSLSLFDVEREIIIRALAKFDGNRTRTAEYLEIPRHVLLYRIEKFEIS